MNIKLLIFASFITLALASTTPLPENCHYVEHSVKEAYIVENKKTRSEPYIGHKYRKVTKNICSRRKTTKTVKIPSSKSVKVTVNKRKLVTIQYQEKVPVLVTVQKTKKEWFKKPYFKTVQKKKIEEERRSQVKVRTEVVPSTCTKYVLKTNQKVFKRPYIGYCESQSQQSTRCVKYMNENYTESYVETKKYPCDKTTCKKHKSYYFVRVVKSVPKKVKKYQFFQKDVTYQKLVVQYKKVTKFKKTIKKVPTTTYKQVITYTEKNVPKSIEKVEKVEKLERYEVVLQKDVPYVEHEVAFKTVVHKKVVCLPPIKRKCVVWGDPHYEDAYGKNYTSRSVIGDTLLAKTNNIVVHGRVVQWELDATVVSAVAFEIKKCSKKFFIRGDGLFINKNDVSVDDFNEEVAKCDAEISKRMKDEFITEYKLKIDGSKELLTVLVGSVQGEVEWKEFTEEELEKRKKQGLAKYWMEVALLGFIKPQGACAGQEEQASGIFYNTQVKQELELNLKKKDCAIGHYEKAAAHCKKEFQSEFTINSCIFDQCHKMSMLAEVTFKKSVESAQFEARLYNAREAKDWNLVTELLRKRAELKKKILGEKHVTVEQKTWNKRD